MPRHQPLACKRGNHHRLVIFYLPCISMIMMGCWLIFAPFATNKISPLIPSHQRPGWANLKSPSNQNRIWQCWLRIFWSLKALSKVLQNRMALKRASWQSHWKGRRVMGCMFMPVSSMRKQGPISLMKRQGAPQQNSAYHIVSGDYYP